MSCQVGPDPGFERAIHPRDLWCRIWLLWPCFSCCSPRRPPDCWPREYSASVELLHAVQTGARKSSCSGAFTFSSEISARSSRPSRSSACPAWLTTRRCRGADHEVDGYPSGPSRAIDTRLCCGTIVTISPTTLVPFVDEGLELGEPVLVAVTNEHTHWLRAALGEPAADRVRFVDMERLGRNPARIIPAWRDFVATPAGESRPSEASGSRSGRAVMTRSWRSASCMRRS